MRRFWERRMAVLMAREFTYMLWARARAVRSRLPSAPPAQALSGDDTPVVLSAALLRDSGPAVTLGAPRPGALPSSLVPPRWAATGSDGGGADRHLN